ncbi:MAG: hypothetical protein D6746_01085 [Bacteroidetes bacterium]|nr:MAG: hypothetical protein D6746_01085 [Bacteroidota bacterium]
MVGVEHFLVEALDVLPCVDDIVFIGEHCIYEYSDDIVFGQFSFGMGVKQFIVSVYMRDYHRCMANKDMEFHFKRFWFFIKVFYIQRFKGWVINSDEFQGVGYLVELFY